MTAPDVEHDTLLDMLWQCREAFPGFIDPDIYRDYLLALYFFKAVSDERQDYFEYCMHKYPDDKEIRDGLMDAMRFTLPLESRFKWLHTFAHEDGLGERLDRMLAELVAVNPATLKGIFYDLRFVSRDLGPRSQGDRILRELLGFFKDKRLDLRPSRFRDPGVIGRVFWSALQKFAGLSGSPADPYPTPQPVAQLMARLLDPQPGDAICDPACGSGGLLTACADLLVQTHGRQCCLLRGQEANCSRWATARMHMLLRRIDNCRIEWDDTLRNPLLLEPDGTLTLFDVVLSSPESPFTRWRKDAAKGDRHGRFALGVPTNQGANFAFILHMLATLKPGTGRMAVLLHDIGLMRVGAERMIRQKLVEANLVDAMISLPAKLAGGTGSPATLLLMRHNKMDDAILFIDAAKDKAPFADVLARVCEAYRARADVRGYAALVRTTGADGDFNLDAKRRVAAAAGL